MRPEVVTLIARSAKSGETRIRVGQTLNDVIKEKCGHIDPAYVTAFRRANAAKIQNAEQARPFSNEVDLDVPACLYSTTQPFPYTAKDNDTLSSIALKFTGFAGPKTLARFRQVNGARALVVRGGRIVTVPYRAKATELRFEDGAKRTAFEDQLGALDDYYRSNKVAKAQGGATRSNAGISNNIGLCAPVLERRLVECDGESPSYPTDKVELSKVLAILKWLRLHQSPALSPGVVIVVDSGVTGFEHTDFTSGHNMPSSFERQDLNVYALESGSQTIGQSFASLDGLNPERPSPIIDNAYFWQHGTYIAGIVSGRLLDSAVRAVSAGRVQFSAFNVFGKDVERPLCDRYAISPALVNLSVKESRDLPTSGTAMKIVNLSLSYDHELNILRSMRDSNNLYVASAGNYPIDIDDSQRRLFPAYYGRELLKNLVVVAAHDAKDRIVPGTAVGKSTVDLAAPGCKIKSLVGATLTDVETLSGTSQAAAIVSYTAALLSGNVANMDAASIKNRLVLTVDERSDFGKLRSGGKLNIPKAIAANLDVVEMVEGNASKTVYGVVQELSDRLELCGASTNWSLSTIGRIDLKKVAVTNLRAVRVLTPWGEIKYSGECSVGERSLSFRKYVSPGLLGPIETIKLSDISQIIPMAPGIDRRWQRLNVQHQD